MPEKPPSNRPARLQPVAAGRSIPKRPGEPTYAELLAASNFSFLRGASHPEELAAAAAVLGLDGFAIADRNTLAGVVRGHLAAKQTGARYAVGCRLAFRDGTPDIAVWPSDRAAYGRLCRLLTIGNLRAEKGACHLDLADLLEWGAGLELAILPGRRLGGSPEKVKASGNSLTSPPPEIRAHRAMHASNLSSTSNPETSGLRGRLPGASHSSQSALEDTLAT